MAVMTENTFIKGEIITMADSLLAEGREEGRAEIIRQLFDSKMSVTHITSLLHLSENEVNSILTLQ